MAQGASHVIKTVWKRMLRCQAIVDRRDSDLGFQAQVLQIVILTTRPAHDPSTTVNVQTNWQRFPGTKYAQTDGYSRLIKRLPLRIIQGLFM